MYERFTDRARKVMQLANYEARRCNYSRIGTEQILLGLMKEGSGVAAGVLRVSGLDLRKVRQELDRIVPPGTSRVVEGKLPLTRNATQVVENAMKEAESLQQSEVDAEHLLLGLTLERECVAAQVLIAAGLNLDNVRNGIMEKFSDGFRSLS